MKQSPALGRQGALVAAMSGQRKYIDAASPRCVRERRGGGDRWGEEESGVRVAEEGRGWVVGKRRGGGCASVLTR